MGMLIPLNTDAPLYHYPFGTIGLIVANLGCFALTGFGTDSAALEPWALQYGEGLSPVQWFSSAFAHAGVMHILGNMFFLWGFGLVVEGKLGWLLSTGMQTPGLHPQLLASARRVLHAGKELLQQGVEDVEPGWS